VDKNPLHFVEFFPGARYDGGDWGAEDSMTDYRTAHLQNCLDRLQGGDEAARKELLEGACERLKQLTRTMLRDYRRLKRWEDTGDVLQSALVRLYRALQEVTPPSLREFYRLATMQIRRELIDLSRHYYGPQGPGRLHASNINEKDSHESYPLIYEMADSSDGPARLAVWTEFHRQVEALPDEEREVFDLVWYQGLQHTEAAAMLDVSARTVKRRWQSACLKLHEAMRGELPGR
jgi:RNA polymerase sigma-70 factor (ECF subfamily)